VNIICVIGIIGQTIRYNNAFSLSYQSPYKNWLKKLKILPLKIWWKILEILKELKKYTKIINKIKKKNITNFGELRRTPGKFFNTDSEHQVLKCSWFLLGVRRSPEFGKICVFSKNAIFLFFFFSSDNFIEIFLREARKFF